ncbi:hypothetical protein JCM10450v2_000304 [Rhodotorula kratochvilovae]
MPKRTTKKVATRKAPAPASDAEDGAWTPVDDEVEDAPVERTPPKKKARTSTSRVKGRRGVLSAFSSLPFDLVYEICANLDPQDLFALSTTSKVFRSVVTGNLAAGLWKGAREHVGLPELEVPMTDLQYAQLLFGKGCSFCTRKNAGKPDVFYRARICTACLKDHFATNATAVGNAAIKKAVDHKLHPLTLSVVKYTNPYARYGQQYRLDEVKKINDDLFDNFPDTLDTAFTDCDFVTRRGGNPRNPYGMYAAADETLEPTTSFQKWWCDSCEQPRKARSEDGNKLRDWVAEQDRNKAMSKYDKRKARREELERRFKEQGFVDQEFTSYDWGNHTLVRKPDLLTDRTWANVEAQLKAKLLENRAARRKSGLSARIRALRYNSAAMEERPLVAYQPTEAVAASVPTFQALIDDVSTFVEPDQLWELNKDLILDEVDELVRSRIEEMLRALADAYADVRAARARGEEIPAMDGGDASALELPRLPSFVPRTLDRPLVATDAQLVAFLQEHRLSIFTCAVCHAVLNGDAALKHAASSYCSPGDGLTTDANMWARCGQPEHNNLAVDKTILMQGLYLHQLHDAVELVVPASLQHYEELAAKFGVEMATDKKLRKKWDCNCARFYNPAYASSRSPIAEVYRHIRDAHAAPDQPLAQLSVKVEYTPAFHQALQRAKYRAGEPDRLRESLGVMYDSDGYDSDGYDSLDDVYGYRGGGGLYDGYGAYYSDEDEDVRDECSIM